MGLPLLTFHKVLRLSCLLRTSSNLSSPHIQLFSQVTFYARSNILLQICETGVRKIRLTMYEFRRGDTGLLFFSFEIHCLFIYLFNVLVCRRSLTHVSLFVCMATCGLSSPQFWTLSITFLICNVKFSVFVMSLLTGDVINLSFCCVQDSAFQRLFLYFIYLFNN